MKALFKILMLSQAAMIGIEGPAWAEPVVAATSPTLQYAKQGWTAQDRQTFYTTSQGSHMMRYVWYKALRRLDVDEPFGGDQLQRYGYLPNDKSEANPEGLPAGFVIDGDASSGFLGMTCAACHTAEIEYQSGGAMQRLRIDGAPAMADFQLFLTELTEAARATLQDTNRFQPFARTVLGSRFSTARTAVLKTEFGNWVDQFGGFIDKSLPASPWGPGRLDAFGMIFNRVAGSDLGIDANIKVADAPVSYPFLWNASRQDKTQWNGGVPNGLFLDAQTRNTGEVLGVFADLSPKRLPLPHLVDYSNNSVKFAGLQHLEEEIAVLQPPPWPFGLKQDLADKGETLFKQYCADCHEEKLLPHDRWLTPVNAVGTDSKMFLNSRRSSQSGMLAGALSPNPPGSKLDDPALTVDILAATVVGALINEAFPLPPKLPNPNGGVWQAIRKDLSELLPDSKNIRTPLLLLDPKMRANLRSSVESRLANMFRPPAMDQAPAYESRVLHGIWATAPYLHNGSVPNLRELLTPPAQRSPFFMVGSKTYDPVNVGYVTDNSPYKDGKLVVGDGAAPGNSNSGHDYGTALSDDDRWALIEYLKQL
jgi:hypothetical protein